MVKVFALAALVAAAPATAAELGEAKLRAAGEMFLSMSDEDYRDAFGTAGDRPAAVGAVFRDLARRRLKQAEAAGAEPALAAQIKASAAADKAAAGPDKDLLTSAGWADNVSAWLNAPRPSSGRVAVAAVRGGRKLSTADDKAIAAQLAEVDAADKALGDAGLAPAGRAKLHYAAGKAYERVAALAAKPSAPDDEEAPAAAAAPKAALTPKELYAKAAPSVVLVIAGRPDGQGELGTGSVIDKSGRVLTNAHVVVDDRTGKPFPSVRVYLKPARVTGDSRQDMRDPISAKVARYDRALDLAVLELSRPPKVAALSLGDDEAVETGDPVVAIGHPEQGGLWTLTQGVISTQVSDLGGVKGKNVFQTDASINRGNSGGPLIDRGGDIIGVNTSMARKAADGLTITSVNFSVKSSVARAWLGGGAPPSAARPSAPAFAAAPAAVEPSASEEPAPAAEPEAAPEPAAPAPRAPEASPAPAEELPPPPKTKPAVLTPARPYRIEDVVEAEMKEMEDMGAEMEREIRRRAGGY